MYFPILGRYTYIYLVYFKHYRIARITQTLPSTLCTCTWKCFVHPFPTRNTVSSMVLVYYSWELGYLFTCITIALSHFASILSVRLQLELLSSGLDHLSQDPYEHWNDEVVIKNHLLIHIWRGNRMTIRTSSSSTVMQHSISGYTSCCLCTIIISSNC